MAAAVAGSSRRTTAARGPVLRSLSPSRRFSPSSSATAFASSSSSFSTRSSTFFSRNRHQDQINNQRSASPTRVNLYSQAPSTPSVRFSFDRPISPNRSISSVNAPSRHHHSHHQSAPPKRTCMCSPTNHPGSFRCSLHKGFGNGHHSHHSANNSPSNRLNARRSAMTNSLVRIGGVEGDLVKRALSALIRPSSHQQRRRAAFQPRPSRLSTMTKAEDLNCY